MFPRGGSNAKVVRFTAAVKKETKKQQLLRKKATKKNENGKRKIEEASGER